MHSLALNSDLAAPSTSGRSTFKQHGGGHQGANACKDMSKENASNLFVTRFLSKLLSLSFF
jgi:hypothetical protein